LPEVGNTGFKCSAAGEGENYKLLLFLFIFISFSVLQQNEMKIVLNESVKKKMNFLLKCENIPTFAKFHDIVSPKNIFITFATTKNAHFCEKFSLFSHKFRRQYKILTDISAK
jgi:hypothetical protein